MNQAHMKNGGTHSGAIVLDDAAPTTSATAATAVPPGPMTYPALQPSAVHPRLAPAIRVVDAGLEHADRWDAFVAGQPDGTPFHTFAWRRAVEETFGHAAHYFMALRGDDVAGVLPAFLIRTPWVGARLVSVPYAVGGGILACDDAARDALYGAVLERAGRLKSRCVEFRSMKPVLPALNVSDRYLGFRRALPARPEDVLETLPRKARAVVRQARDKHRLTLEHGDHHLAEVWRLYAVNMRRLASLNYPLRFFERLLAHAPDRHRVTVICHHGEPVAGLVTFTFRDVVYPYFFGARPDSRRCGAAHLAYAELMEWAVAGRYRLFDFGRTRRDNAGGVAFKRLMGFQPQSLGYQTWAPGGGGLPNLTPDNPKFRWVRRVWPILPLVFTTRLGAAASRYIPG